jgi:hypothetical protein
VPDSAYDEEVFNHAQELQDLFPGLSYEHALYRARIEIGRREK